MPPRARPFGRRGFFRTFSAHFCVTLEHQVGLWNTYFSSAKTSKENGHENGRENGREKKICAKMGAKICAPKMGAKMGGKICAPRICAKNRVEHSVCLEDGSQKKKHKKKSVPKLSKTPARNLISNSSCSGFPSIQGVALCLSPEKKHINIKRLPPKLDLFPTEP